MSKPIIGIISGRAVGDPDRIFQTKTSFNETYSQRIIEAGGIPVGIIFPNNNFNTNLLDICDGFIFQGGSTTIESAQINTIHYTLQKEKPILGICLGFQTMIGYAWIRGEFGDIMPTYSEIDSIFKPEDEANFIALKSNHDNLNPFFLSLIEKSKHEILLDKNSKLAHIFKTTYLEMPSAHAYSALDKVLDTPKDHIFKVVGRSSDGNIEAVENVKGDWWAVGVQFHPELEKENLPLFESLVAEAKRKKLKNH